MTRVPRREVVERFDRFQRQFARARARRRADHFQAELDALVKRTATPQTNQTIVAPRPTTTSTVDPADKARFEQGMRDLLVRVHGRPHAVVEPAGPGPRRGAWWSPTPVLGFRAWQLLNGRWHGAKQAWDAPTRSAECLHRKPGVVPHDVTECGRPACGIYALKDPDQLLGMVAPWFGRTPTTLLLGMVTMSGRVIEHAAGFRAQHVRIEAAAVVSGTSRSSRRGWFDVPGEIQALFATPDRIVEGLPIYGESSAESLRAMASRLAARAAAD